MQNKKHWTDLTTTWRLKTPQSCWRNQVFADTVLKAIRYLFAQAINGCSGQAPATQPIHGAPLSWMWFCRVCISFWWFENLSLSFPISFCLDPHTWIVWKQGECQHVNVNWNYLLHPFTALLIWACPLCLSSQRGRFSCSYWYFHRTLSPSPSLTEPSFQDISIFALLQPEMSQENDSNLQGWTSLIWQMRITWVHNFVSKLRRCNPILNCLNCGARPWSQLSMEEKQMQMLISLRFQLDFHISTRSFYFSTSQVAGLGTAASQSQSS